MVAERRTSPTDDLITELIRAEDDGDHLNMDELRMLAGGILMAGTDTTRNQVAAAVDVLCDHPDQWATARRPTRTGDEGGRRADALLPRGRSARCA